MPKETFLYNEAWDKLEAGVIKLATVVKSTMGPNGQNVIISKDNRVAITKDGVTVALEVDLPDPNENVAAQLIKQVAHKTVLETGDGTTTATVLAEAIFVKGLEYLKKGANPRELLEGINAATEATVAALKDLAHVADTSKALQDVATISANGDVEIGEWIAQAFEEVGRNGLVTAQISRAGYSEFEIVKGINFASGYASPIFLDNMDSGEITYARPLIFLYDDRVRDINDLMPVLEYSSKAKADDGKPMPIVIVATGFDAAVFPTLHKSKVAGLLRPVLIKAPGNADTQAAFFNDLAVATGGRLVSAKLDNSLKLLTTGELIAQHVGSCERITVSANETRVREGAGSEESIDAYVTKLQELVDTDGISDSAKIILQERISKLSKGIAVIHVGGESEVAAREKYERVDDAINATKAAIAEGYVPGGGHAFLYARLKMMENALFGPTDWISGIEVVREAIKAPFETIVANSNRDLQKVMQMNVPYSRKEGDFEVGFGYDARQHKIVNLIEAGIIDPVKVTRRALQNAVSIASMMLNSSVLMVSVPDNVGPKLNMSL